MKPNFSFIIPVYNRPQEIEELLKSMQQLNFGRKFEVVIVEDGSQVDSEAVVRKYSEKLNIRYFRKENSGPGDSRNFGMKRAEGDYFLILDSDVLLPPEYLKKVEEHLDRDFVHCFGGPDAADRSFSTIQKAINYSMTSFLTTGGIRGGKKMLDKFQPRSFNMGLSKKAFETSGGFGNIHPGEDPDLALRLQKSGFRTSFFSEAFVYHKRRIDWEKFFQQVYKFGLVRPILNEWHPESAKVTFWFPSLFILGLLLALGLVLFGIPQLLYLYLFYFLVLFFDSLLRNKSLIITVLSLWAVMIQFSGYGFGFCRSTYYIRVLNKDPKKKFPKLFFQDA